MCCLHRAADTAWTAIDAQRVCRRRARRYVCRDAAMVRSDSVSHQQLLMQHYSQELIKRLLAQQATVRAAEATLGYRRSFRARATQTCSSQVQAVWAWRGSGDDGWAQAVARGTREGDGLCDGRSGMAAAAAATQPPVAPDHSWPAAEPIVPAEMAVMSLHGHAPDNGADVVGGLQVTHLDVGGEDVGPGATDAASCASVCSVSKPSQASADDTAGSDAATVGAFGSLPEQGDLKELQGSGGGAESWEVEERGMCMHNLAFRKLLVVLHSLPRHMVLALPRDVLSLLATEVRGQPELASLSMLVSMSILGNGA
jgi:hypothetical protein